MWDRIPTVVNGHDGLVKNGKILNDETFSGFKGQNVFGAWQMQAWISSGHLI